MSYHHPYDSYLSNLDSLVFDLPSEVVHSDKDVADELDLWSNAQFTFDVKPGVGIYDEEKSKASPKTTRVNSSSSNTSAALFESASGLDPVTYDTLVNYLDYELPRQQDKLNPTMATHSSVETATTKSPPSPLPAVKKQRIQPRPLAPALAPHAPTTIARQVLMPRPSGANIMSSLLATANTSSNAPTAPAAAVAAVPPASPKKVAAKRTITEVEECLDESAHPDEDKRRRNTAASARFRVKKKMREQAMEQSVREMAEKSDKLQGRVNDLESEIKYLRRLLLDKAAHGQ